MQAAFFVTGSGSGTGKTTIADALHREFQQRNVPVHCWYEIEVMQRKEFRPFLHLFMQSDDEMVPALQSALKTYLAEQVPGDRHFVTESLIPFLRWLILGAASTDAINRHCEWLRHTFIDWEVTLIALQCGKSEAVNRARQDRGDAWHHQWLLKQRDFPLYRKHPEMDHWSVFLKEKVLYSKLGWRVLDFDTTESARHVIVDQALGEMTLPAATVTPPLNDVEGMYWSDSMKLDAIELKSQRIMIMGQWLDLVPLTETVARIANSNATLELSPQGVLLKSGRFGQIQFQRR